MHPLEDVYGTGTVYSQRAAKSRVDAVAQARRNLISRLSLCVPSLIELILAGVECGINV